MQNLIDWVKNSKCSFLFLKEKPLEDFFKGEPHDQICIKKKNNPLIDMERMHYQKCRDRIVREAFMGETWSWFRLGWQEKQKGGTHSKVDKC